MKQKIKDISALHKKITEKGLSEQEKIQHELADKVTDAIGDDRSFSKEGVKKIKRLCKLEMMSLDELWEHCLKIDSGDEEGNDYTIFESFGHLGLNILKYTNDIEEQKNILKCIMRSYEETGHGESTIIGALQGDDECEKIVSCWAGGDYNCEYEKKGFNSPKEYV